MTDLIVRPSEFRILIIGRANAGKTSILRAVCGAEGEPDVYDQRGRKITQRPTRSAFRTILRRVYARHPHEAPDLELQERESVLSPTSLRGEHNIEHSLRFPGSPGFVFHDSRGFESGAVEELELVREFIRKNASQGSMKDQLHAIWYCFPTDSNRFMTAADKEFFDTIDTGTVPVIAIFTKFDALDATACGALIDQGVPFEEAQMQAPEHAQAQFNQDLLPLVEQLAHPPRAVVCLRNMNHTGSLDIIQKAASELIESTGGALDDGALKMLLVQAQRVNVELCIKLAVDGGAITSAAQDALQEDPTIFKPLQKEWVKAVVKCFPSIWVCVQNFGRHR
ncbi:hypothetical protein BOTBODRAFT_32324 [Botryobasidium botryosum FD-172 SS1]|uniref:Uncharacterized protein n=1 Tax=Botryobasidium botryosum (strain FD-172 SS1) TaxID=930990 RepID=A0A067MHF6_BOTB1|nr:hypothetical protein BOTBODRAFT_32324 [Botryobasidium botryosum FD-172 SS1]